MAFLNVTLTDDMLRLVSRINFEQFPPVESWEGSQKLTWGIDINSLYGGSFMFEDISYILGIYDRHIEGTEFDSMGPRFSKEDEDYMYGLHSYILEHLQDIEEIVHQFCNRGGVKPGTYKCKPNERIWEFSE
ncbi:MAG: hypothetical protein J6X18_04880 [Bacteroidales bacterium]|nr:hypothetical protein [Bacteroidales bacterium]